MTRLHDHCCNAGQGSDGYAAVLGAAAIQGSDLEDQPDYPYPFEQRDAMEELEEGPRAGVTAHHWSFPCQPLTTAGHLRTAQGGVSKYPDLLTPGMVALRSPLWRDTPWIVENVDDNQGKVRAIMAPGPGEYLITLCGSMFGLQVQRHRLFLANFPLRRPEPTGKGVYGQMGCRHDTFPIGPNGRPKPIGVYHVPGDKVPSGGHTARDAEHGRQAMGSHRTLPWAKLKEGFPPAYTSWVAADLLRAVL